MRRALPIITLCVVIGLLLWWWPKSGPSSSETAATTPTPPEHISPAEAPRSTPPAPAAPPSPDVSPTPDATRAAPLEPASAPASDPRRKRALLLRFDRGALSLVEQTALEGDFAPPRRPPEAWSGMLRLRLLAADGSVLAEEISPAPDQLCTVLDAHAGAERPVDYVVPGPVVFQARLPRSETAVRLDVSRITQPGDPARDTPLGSLPLPPL